MLTLSPSPCRCVCRPGSDRMYNFTSLAITLNEPEEGVAPTDSRLRPDQRAMEEGRWDDANKLKQELEEKQRAARKKREAEMEEASKRGKEHLSSVISLCLLLGESVHRHLYLFVVRRICPQSPISVCCEENLSELSLSAVKRGLKWADVSTVS